MENWNCPKVFIIILNYNGKDILKKCLLSVFKNDYPNFEIVLVDNNSTDGSLETAKADFSKAHFIKNEENLGFSAGNNIGIRFALERMADYILLLNNDVEVEKDFLSHLISIAQENREVGVLSPLIFDGNTRQVWFSGGIISWLRMKSFHKKTTKKKDFYESSFVTGCAMLVKKEVFKKIGLFDEDYFLYWEDADFGLRAGKAGFKKVVVTSSWVYHFEKSQKNKENKTYWLVISGLVFFRKNTPAYLRLWMIFYLSLRKIKNYADILIGKNKLAPIVRRAYKDFKNDKI
jgi:GT2 family glycosyltransferase